MKASNIFCTVLLILICGCAEYPAYEVTNPPFVNRTSLNMYIEDEIQLTASPADGSFVWSSDNEAVASVSQTGLVKALSEGLASITVKSADDEVRIDVRVRTFIPFTDINLPITSAKIYTGYKSQLWAYPIPENASEVVFTWRSENPEVATVDKNGIVTAVSKGTTNIIVSSGDIEKTIAVTVDVAIQYKMSFNANGANSSLTFTDAGDYVTIVTTGEDPNITTSPIGKALGGTAAKLIFEYMSNKTTTDIEIFWCVDGGPVGGKSTGGITIEEAGAWTRFEFDLAHAKETFGFGQSATHFIRLDPTGGSGYEISIRNLRIETYE